MHSQQVPWMFVRAGTARWTCSVSCVQARVSWASNLVVRGINMLLKSHLYPSVSAMAEGAVERVLAEWRQSQPLCARGMMATVESKKDLSRRDVCHNVDVVKAVVRHLGL